MNEFQSLRFQGFGPPGRVNWALMPCLGQLIKPPFQGQVFCLMMAEVSLISGLDDTLPLLIENFSWT